jgi:hypothetical protein
MRGVQEIQDGQASVAESEYGVASVDVTGGNEAVRIERKCRARNYAGKVVKRLICWIEHGVTRLTAEIEILQLFSREGEKYFLNIH